MSKIRVLRIQSRICVGGPALNTTLLSAHMDAERFQTLLVGGGLLPTEKSVEQMVLDKGVPLKIIESMGRSISWKDDLRALRELMRLIRFYQPHIVHTHTAKAGALGRVAAFLCRVPIRVHTFHGHTFHGYFPPLVSRLVVLTEKMLAMISHRIVAISPRQKEDLTRQFAVVPEKKCEIVRLGFELGKMVDRPRGAFRARLGVDEEVRLVGILARLVPIKNHELLIRAVAEWRKQRQAEGRDYRGVLFLIIGDGELRSELEALAKELGVCDLVRFTGWQDRVAEIYADLDLNVLVSRNEGTPVTLIEGLACGLPALSTDVGGVRDFLDETGGQVVPPDVSPADLALALEQMLTRPQRRLPEEAAERVRKMYDVSRLVGDMERLYETLIRDKRISPV